MGLRAFPLVFTLFEVRAAWQIALRFWGGGEVKTAEGRRGCCSRLAYRTGVALLVRATDATPVMAYATAR